MGFDVTFHPVSLDDLQRYCFDVIDDVELARARAADIAAAPGKLGDLVDGVLSRLPGFVAELRAGEPQFGSTVAMAAAAVAGYIHPFWYARGSALSFLAEKHPEVTQLLTSLPRLARGRVTELEDESGGLLSANYTASGLVQPRDLLALSALIEELATPKGGKAGPIFEVFDDEGLDSLRRAIDYARRRGLGLMEATDLVVPFSGECYTDGDNLRAHYLDNVERTELGRAPAADKKKARKPARKAAKKPAKQATRRPAKKAVKKATKKAPKKALKKPTKKATKKPTKKKAKRPAKKARPRR